MLSGENNPDPSAFHCTMRAVPSPSVIHSAAVGAHDGDDNFVVRAAAGAELRGVSVPHKARPDNSGLFEEFTAVDWGFHRQPEG